MGVGTYDAIDDIINMMNDEWNYDNDDVPKPKFTVNWEEKATGIIDDTQDIVVLTPGNEKIDYFSLYGRDHLHYPVVIIDIRGYGTETRHRNVVDQIDKILKAQVRRTGYTDLRITSTKNLSHNYRNMHRYVMEATYRILNP
jgi:hypothetical protein